MTSLLDKLRSKLGPDALLTEAHDMAAYVQDWRGRYRGDALCVVRPRSATEVATVVGMSREAGVAIVPQGGNTGLVGGAVPTKDTVVLNVSRMNAVRTVDVANNAMTVDAGVVLQTVRDEAEKHERHFPMLLGSVGSCQIGGLVSTNAGGTGVLRYGNMRELVLGLEVVLPDGRIWNGLRALRKDNSGYDLKHLFIGAEGTLGIVTAVVLKLFPRLTRTATAMVALPDVPTAIALLHHLQANVGNRVEAFEIMSRSQLETVCAHGRDLKSPMAIESPWYALIEIADSDPSWDATAHLERCLEVASEKDWLTDAVVAADLGKAERIWALRHNVSEANKHAGFTVSNDTSVPISRVPVFITNVEQRLRADIRGIRINHVGHIGDGNVHVVAVLPRDIYTTQDACEAVAADVNFIVHDESVQLGGSIAAEHGIGKMHVARLGHFKPALDLDMMRSIKDLFDPLGLMNPGKILAHR